MYYIYFIFITFVYCKFFCFTIEKTDDYLVSDKYYSLVGPQMLEFRKDLMKSKSPTTLPALVPKDIKSKNVEGSELLDCEWEEIQNEDVIEDKSSD